MPKKAEKIRLNLELSPQTAERLERLQDLSDSPSRVEVIRRALSLFDLALSTVEGGGKLQLEHADGSIETLRLL